MRIYRATIKGRHGNGVLCQPTLHYQTDVPIAGDEPDPSDVAAGIWTVIGTTLKGISPNDLIWTSLDVAEQVLDPAIGAAGSSTITGGSGVVIPDSKLPYACVPVINLHTGVASKSSRGWVHGPGCRTGGNMSGDSWTGAFQSTLQNFANTLKTSFDLGTLQITHVNPVVYSRTRHLRGADPWSFKVTSATTNPQVRWLRSRLSSP